MGLDMIRIPEGPAWYALALSLVLWPSPGWSQTKSEDIGVLPVGADGKPLNLDFETGTLKDWTADGPAFENQPIEGDLVAVRRPDMKSDHQGKYWVGTYEQTGDAPQGTLTSATFTVTHPWATFLVAGGSEQGTAVELVRADTEKAFFRATGDVTETLKRVLVDLKEHQGKPIYIRVIDDLAGGWGHVNFDDFRFHAQKPTFPVRSVAAAPDVYAHNGLTPEEAAKAMTVPPGFSVSLFAGEPDVVQPIAMSIDERGRLWVAEAYSYPTKLPDDQAKDRILIFEDKDNDGRFDTKKVFADKLNLVSGLELGFGGVWVGAAPHLLFIPDANHDDTPDGPPQVLLDGWAMQDTHETLNSFIWGPDGWLYGCHGVFTHSRVGKPGTPDDERTPINAGIWRYHPTKHIFEVFSQGTSNPWGVDFDRNGQCFIEACVIPHLYHMIQGGRYERQAGGHFNPFTYDDIKTIADHRHYVGGNPHSGNGRSDSAGGGHAHSGLMIYDGGLWPKELVGGLYMNNIHGARLNHDVVTPKGSGYVGGHQPDFLLANDAWSQIVYFRSGPDGNMYMIDWYDKNQCHRNETEMHDRTNGRIFKVSYGDNKPASTDLRALSDTELAALTINSTNNWSRRTARRLLQERAADGTLKEIKGLANVFLSDELMKKANPDQLLEALWLMHATGQRTARSPLAELKSANPMVRAWSIQLACEDRNPDPEVLKAFARLAADKNESPVVRLYLASAVQRLPATFNAAKWPIIEALAAHGEDAGDHNLPLMVWYALEPLAAADSSRALAIAESSELPNLLSFTIRRIAAMGTPEAYSMLTKGIEKAGETQQAVMLAGLAEALKGRRDIPMPASWPAVYKKLRQSADERVLSLATGLGVSFGDPEALGWLRQSLLNEKTPVESRLAALESLVQARDRMLPAFLNEFIAAKKPEFAAPQLRAPAIRAMAAFDHPGLVNSIVEAYPKLSVAEKRDALTTLAARSNYAHGLLDAVASKKIAGTDLSGELIRNLRNLKDEKINDRITEVWGQVRETSADKAKLIDQYRNIVKQGYVDAPDPSLGRLIYAKSCGQCHVLFGTGGNVGPDLTGSNRADLEYVLTNVMDPSALVGKDYQATIIATKDGRTLTGIVKAEDANTITMITANEILALQKSDVEERKLTEQSLMPEDQWNNLKDHEIRSLVAYLASPGQVALMVTPENAETFFNGKDLSGWVGDPALWSVENGQIVGKTTGLAHNDFLRSEISATDFRLSFEVMLVKDEGNSGVQFRSQPLPDGEMKGPQADIGPGWWGKLYDEQGRGLLWDKSAEAHVKKGEWNTYQIEAIGSKVQTHINGHLSVDLDDAKLSKRGVFALQLHSGGPTEVRYRNLKLVPVVAEQPASP